LLVALQKAVPSADSSASAKITSVASIGKEIEFNALLSVGVSMLVILVYIAFRFEFGFGVGAMFSTLHDILMTIGIFVLTGRQFSAPMVAAILCIAGYSIKRNRRRLRPHPGGAQAQSHRYGTLRDIINSAINKVFRTHDHDGLDDFPRGARAVFSAGACCGIFRSPSSSVLSLDFLRDLHRGAGFLLVAQGRPETRRGACGCRPEVRVAGLQQSVE